jgi:hypothetical protein
MGMSELLISPERVLGAGEPDDVERTEVADAG